VGGSFYGTLGTPHLETHICYMPDREMNVNRLFVNIYVLNKEIIPFSDL